MEAFSALLYSHIRVLLLGYPLAVPTYLRVSGPSLKMQVLKCRYVSSSRPLSGRRLPTKKKRKEIKIKKIHPASLGHLRVEAGMLLWSLFITAAQSVFRGALI